MIKRVSALVATTALAATMMLGAIAIPAQAAIRHIDGTVVSKNSENRSFRIRTQSGSQPRIKVTSSTKFQRLAGFGALHKGLAVEVDAKNTSNGLVAIQVETSGGGGADDGPNHT